MTSSSASPVSAASASSPDVAPEPERTGAVEISLTPLKSAAWENELRGRLGLLPKAARISQKVRMQGWIVTAIVTIIAFVTRLWNLNHPRALVFDETYYVKGAFSLLKLGFEGDWLGEDPNPNFLNGDLSVLSTTDPDYVVHPPFGKWLMAIGQALFGSDNGAGWRFTTAILGVAAVFIVARIAMRMFRSPWAVAIAGGAMALDGMGIVLSRTGLLDNVLAFFAILAFYTLLLDRDQFRARLAKKVAHGPILSDGTPANPWGPRVGLRPWLILTGLVLGLSCGVKWSGIYVVAVCGIVTYAWSASARKSVGITRWFTAGTLRDGVSAFLQLIPITIVAYVGAWLSWFLNPHSYNRGWAERTLASGGEVPFASAPNIVNDFISYHQAMWDFHHGLSTPHDYQSPAWQWLFQIRPVSFYWNGKDEMASQCPSGKECVQAISSIGNPFVWWLGVIALVLVVWVAYRKGDWRAWTILAGYCALWVPWLTYTNRTIFNFYAVAFLPFVVLALAFGIAYYLRFLTPAQASARTFEEITGVSVEVSEAAEPRGTNASSDINESSGANESSGTDEPSGTNEQSESTAVDALPDSNSAASELGSDSDLSEEAINKALAEITEPWWEAPSPDKSARIAVFAIMGLITVAAIFWMPLWLGTTVSYNFWHLHMWMPGWI